MCEEKFLKSIDNSLIVCYNFFRKIFNFLRKNHTFFTLYKVKGFLKEGWSNAQENKNFFKKVKEFLNFGCIISD